MFFSVLLKSALSKTILAFVFFASMIVSASAQESVGLSEELQPLLDAAKDKGVNIIVISPEEETGEVVDTGPTISDQAVTVRTELQRILPQVLDLPAIVWDRILALGDGSAMWVLIAIDNSSLFINTWVVKVSLSIL